MPWDGMCGKLNHIGLCQRVTKQCRGLLHQSLWIMLTRIHCFPRYHRQQIVQNCKDAHPSVFALYVSTVHWAEQL